ncbi:MAG: hypothetical protein IJ017_04645 [Oscillospiraceae bacterium]|nr:hypothetical protein [Oscillospiraceae bacterium]
MAYQLSNEIRAQIHSDAEKLRNRNGKKQSNGDTTQTRAVNRSNTKQGITTPAVSVRSTSGYQLSDAIREQIHRDALKLKNRGQTDNVGAAALDASTGGQTFARKTKKDTSFAPNPYKSYNQPAASGEKGSGAQMTKAYSDKRLQDEALAVFKEYGGKSYSEIQEAIAQNTGTDYMSQYRNQVLAQIGQQNRTREDVEREIAETEAELQIAQAEWDAYAEETGYSATGDSRDGYQQHTNRVNELINRKEALQGELWMYDQNQIYAAIPGYSDFAKNSAVNPDSGEWDDPDYRYINNIQREGTVASENRMAAYQYMTDEEVGIYNYLYNVSGKDAADKYLDYLEYSLNERNQQAIYERTYDFANKNLGTKIATSVASIPANLASGVGYLDVLGQRAQRVITGSDKPIDYNRNAQGAYTFTQGAREGAMSGMSDTGKFIYSTAMSMGDSLGVLGISLLTGGGATLLLGGSAATSTMHDAKANGATDGQALAMGLVAGAAETIMERLPLEQLLNISSASGFREIISNIVKQGANEATEEVLTTVVNTAADVLIMGDKNALMRSYENYLAQGYSPEEAKAKAGGEWIKGLMGDALGGFLSGGLFGAGGTAVKNINQYSDRKSKGAGISTSEYTLPLLIDHVEKGYTNDATGETSQYSEETKQTAAEIKTDLSEGKSVSNAKKGKLAEQILKDNADFNSNVLPQILLEAQNREDAAANAEQSAEKTEQNAPKRNIVEKIRTRLQQRKAAKTEGAKIEPAAAKIMAEDVVSSERVYSEKTKAAAQRILDSDTVNDADVQALVAGIKADNPEFGEYTVQEIIAEASIAAQEAAETEGSIQTSAETKAAAPQSTVQQSTDNGGNANEQRTGNAGAEQRAAEGDTASSGRGRRRFSETYSGDAAPVRRAERDVRRAESRAQTASERQNKVAALRVEPTSAASLGIEGGSEDATMYIVPEEAYDEEMNAVKADAEKNGISVSYYTGAMVVSEQTADGMIVGDKMYLKADSNRWSVSETYNHEKFHKVFKRKPKMIEALWNWIRANYTADSFDSIIDTYYEKYNDVYNLEALSEEEATRIVLEEILADAFAGINRFGAGATEYTSAARAGAEIVGDALPGEYNANQGRAPPRGMTYDDVKSAVREVMSEVMGTEVNKNTAEDGGEARYAIAGQRSRTADIEALNTAKEMERTGETPESILAATGWYRGADDLWRYEIDDSRMEYYRSGDAMFRNNHPDYDRYQNLLTKMLTGVISVEEHSELQKLGEIWGRERSRLNERVDRGNATLSEVIRHEALFNAYPELMNTRVVFEEMGEGERGSYNAKNNTITLNQELRKSPESTLVHEIQHAIQNLEGFTSGASPDYWQEMLDRGEQIYSVGMNRALQALVEFEADPENASAIEVSKSLNRYILENEDAKYDDLYEWAQNAGLEDEISEYEDLLFDFNNEKYRMTNKLPSELYENTAGEIEARDVSARRGMSEDMRRLTLPNVGNDDTVFARRGTLSKEEKANAKERVEKLKGSIYLLQTTPTVATLSGNEFDGSAGGRLSDQVESFFDTIGNRVNRPGFGDVELNKRGIKSDIAHGIGRAKAITFAAVPQVIKSGVQIDYQANWKGRGADSYVFAAPVMVDGNMTYVAAVVLKGNDTRFYLHEVVDENGNIIIIRKNSNSETIKTQSYGESRITGSSELLFNNSMTETDADVKQKFALSDEYDVAPEDRTWEDTGDRKFNSYAYDHPELRPYFKEAARAMFYDLMNSVKGERWSTTSDSKEWTGSKRSTSDNIARLLDNGKMTYKRIQDALLTVLYKADDAKAMNRADVKKVELELDAMLQEGYTDPQGYEAEPNREYRRLLDAIKSGYSSVEEADAAYETEMRDEAYEAQVEAEVWEGYDLRADEMYDEVYGAYEPDTSAYEDLTQEDRDYLGEIIESVDEMRVQRLAEEKLRAAQELDEENEALRQRNREYEEEASNYFDAYNAEELAETERRMSRIMNDAAAAINVDISGAPQSSAEHWESITAQLVEDKRRQARENAVAEAENNDMYMPNGATEAEILAAQEKYKEQLAAQKAAEDAKYEGMTVEEIDAAKEAEARQKQAEYLEGVDRKNFVGSEHMKKLGIKIANSIANYTRSASLLERGKANAALVREMDKAIKKMHPSSEEEYFARGIMNNDLSESSIPPHIDADRVLELADYMIARKAGRTDLFAAQKADINSRNRQLAEDKFRGAENAKRVKLAALNYMTPRRAMIEMFGQEQGEEIYRTFFAPVRTNDAERIRFAEKLRQEAIEIVGADGKKGKLTKEERALTQMLMEGKAAGEMLAKMEAGGKDRIEAAAKKILKGEPLREKNGVYVVGEEGGDELSAKEADLARRSAAYTQAQEAIRTGTYDKKKVDGTRITNAAKHFAQQYDLLYEAINEFLVAHGEQPIGFIKGYAPHLQAEGAMKPLERLLEWMGAPTDITDLRAEIAGETQNRKPNRKWNPHFLSRNVGSETDYDVYKGFEEYVDYISEVFYHMDDIMRLRAASRYLRTMYTTEDSRNLLNQIKDVRNGSYYDKMNFLLANNKIARGQTLIGSEVDDALDKYVDEILNEDENKTAVSSALVMWLDNYTNLLAGKQNAMDRGLEQQIGRKGIRAINKAVNRLISAQVVGNLSSALNQMAQLPMTLTELGGNNVAKAIWDLTRHSGEMRRWATENDFLVARKGTTILNYQISDKVTSYLAKPLELSDMLMSMITARAAYHQAIAQKMDAESAMRYSVQKSEDIMGSRNKASKPVAFSTKNPMMRLVNAYQIEVLNQWQHITKDLPKEYKNIAKSRGKWATAGRIAKDIVLYLILAALINRIAEETYGGTPAPLDLLGITGNFIASGNGLTLNEGIVRVFNKIVSRELLPEDHTFDSEMPDEFDWAAAWEDTAYTLSSEIPFLNNVMAVAGLTDDETVFAAGINDAIESGKKAADHFFVTRREREEGEQESAEVLDGLYDVAMGVSEFLMGGRQLQKTIQGIVTVAGGGETNSQGNLMYPVTDNVGSWIQGTLFGKTALESSRAYYASGASPLSSIRNEQYFGMVERGVDEETAYGIAQGLADVTSDKDEDGNTISGSKFMNQMDFVMNADISDEVKSYLALSIASDAAYERYVDYDLEAEGVDPAEFMVGWAFYQSTTGKDKAGQTENFLRQQGISESDIRKIIKALKKK